MHFSEAKNAYFARSRAGKLYNGEDYFLDVDSHTRFAQRWDADLIEMLEEQCPQRSVLTAYPPGFKRGEVEVKSSPIERFKPTAMCFREFGKKDGLPRFKSQIVHQTHHFKRPFRSIVWCAGFSFCHGELRKELLYNDELEFVFFGEEILGTL